MKLFSAKCIPKHKKNLLFKFALQNYCSKFDFVVESEEDSRIDKFLVDKLDLSRVEIQNLIKGMKITKNGKLVTKNSESIKLGDHLVCSELVSKDPFDWNIIEKQNLDGIKIIFEDQDLIVVDKPKGMVKKKNT